MNFELSLGAVRDARADSFMNSAHENDMWHFVHFWNFVHVMKVPKMPKMSLY